MKKVVTLVLVLSMVGLANATLVWNVSGNATPGLVDLGDTITLELEYTGAINGGFTNFDYEIDHADYVAGSFAVGSWGAMFNTLAVVAPDGDGLSIIGGGSAFAMADATYSLFTLQFTVPADLAPASSISGVQIAGNFMNETAPGLCLEVVPEPATMALLGLGALLLRRKK